MLPGFEHIYREDITLAINHVKAAGLVDDARKLETYIIHLESQISIIDNEDDILGDDDD